ncbi:MAG: hypothetical protein LW817_05225 [Candidatus Caenarcaniphilales bacterium]|jgi:hypothetical protein|nr:hypothetical protein [Candidatus Caenarcaniphilales bacterium]
MKQLRTFVVLSLITAGLSQSVSAIYIPWSPETEVVEVEHITNLFKKKHKQPVKIINETTSPVQILSADIRDRGTQNFTELTGVQNTYKIKVQNTTTRPILSYQILSTLKHPFEDYVYSSIEVNSIDALKASSNQTMKFKRDKHFRDDAYYVIKIAKVQYADNNEVWEAPDDDETATRLDAIKKQIDSIEEKSIDDMSVDEIKETTEVKTETQEVLE